MNDEFEIPDPFQRSFAEICYEGDLQKVHNYIIETPNAFLRMGLGFACLGKHLDVMKYLILNHPKKCDIEFAFECAIKMKDQPNMLHIIINLSKQFVCSINWKLLLNIAAKYDNRHAIKWITDQKKSQSWGTVLAGACDGGHYQLTQEIIEQNKSFPFLWNSAIMYACKSGSWEIVNDLIARGANDWNNCLFGACNGGHLSMVDFFLAKGANNYNECFWAASTQRHVDCAKRMIDRAPKDTIKTDDYLYLWQARLYQRIRERNIIYTLFQCGIHTKILNLNACKDFIIVQLLELGMPLSDLEPKQRQTFFKTRQFKQQIFNCVVQHIKHVNVASISRPLIEPFLSYK